MKFQPDTKLLGGTGVSWRVALLMPFLPRCVNVAPYGKGSLLRNVRLPAAFSHTFISDLVVNRK